MLAMAGWGMRSRSAALGLVVLQVGACASLPADQAAGFKTLATGSQAGFAALSGAEADTLAGDELARVASGEQRLMLARSCGDADESEAPCYLVVDGVELGARTARVQKLVAAISLYAGLMADLAAAKDLDAANAATGKVIASLKALAAVVPGYGAAAGKGLDVLAFGLQELRLSQRRKLMLAIAIKAQPVIDRAARALGDEAVQLRASLVDLREKRLEADKTAFDADWKKPAPASPADQAKVVADRTKSLAQIAQDAASVSEARAIKTDFTPLIRSHADLVEVLRDPHAEVTTSVADAQAFQDALKSMTALKPPAAAAKS